MNPLLQAWETTVEDIEAVYRAHDEDIALAPESWGTLDQFAIAKAALYGDGLDEQTNYAYQEIERQLGLTPTKFSIN